MAKKILIVDDDVDIRESLRDFLEGYDVLEAASGEEALRLLRRAHDVGLVVLDVMMPGVNGLDVLAELKRTDPQMGVIILTGHSSKDVAIEALQSHADDYIEKPIDIGKLQGAVEKIMARQNGEPEAASLDLKGKMLKVKKFIEDNCYKKTTLSDAAGAVCLSPKYLSRAFKEQTKTGFNEYKAQVKIGKAKELLMKSGYTVNQIAEKLAYENPESLIREFKKLTGRTPGDYRKKTQRKTDHRRHR